MLVDAYDCAVRVISEISKYMFVLKMKEFSNIILARSLFQQKFI